MRLLFLVCTGFLLLSPCGYANEIVGSQARALTANELDSTSLATLQNKCAKAGLVTIPNKTVCKGVIDKALLTQSSFDYCERKNPEMGWFVSCVENLSGFDYPLSYLEACKKVREGFRSSTKECLQYLAQIEGNFDSEAFQFCIEANEGKLGYAKPCLNAIRDRKVDAQKLRRECVDERSMGERFNDCVVRLTDKSASVNSCGKSATSRGVPTAGAR